MLSPPFPSRSRSPCRRQLQQFADTANTAGTDPGHHHEPALAVAAHGENSGAEQAEELVHASVVVSEPTPLADLVHELVAHQDEPTLHTHPHLHSHPHLDAIEAGSELRLRSLMARDEV